MILIHADFRLDSEFIDCIDSIVGQYYDITLEGLRSKYQGGRYIEPRRLAVHFAYYYTRTRMKDIAARYRISENTAWNYNKNIEMRIGKRDRKIFSRYFYLKESIDKLIEALYPVTYTERTPLLFDNNQKDPLIWKLEKHPL